MTDRCTGPAACITDLPFPRGTTPLEPNKAGQVNIAKALRVNLRNHYRLRGFIADEPELINKVMMGVKVFPNDDTLIDVLNDRDVQTIIISPAKMEELKKSDMADRLLVHNIKLMTAPPLSEWNGQALSRTQLKEIQIEDLLQRNPIEIDIHKVASHLEGKRVMITGAAGSIGSEIMRQVASFNPYKLILVDQAETPLHDIRLELQDRWRDIDAEPIIADISNATRMEDIFREFKPQYIFHAPSISGTSTSWPETVRTLKLRDGIRIHFALSSISSRYSWKLNSSLNSFPNSS